MVKVLVTGAAANAGQAVTRLLCRLRCSSASVFWTDTGASQHRDCIVSAESMRSTSHVR